MPLFRLRSAVSAITVSALLLSGSLAATSAVMAQTGKAPAAKPTTKTPRKTQAESASKTATFAGIAASDKAVKAALKATDLEAAKKLEGKSGAFTGTVAKAFNPKGNGLVILNFAADYKTAITAVVRRKAFGDFPDLSTLVGKTVLVTGKVENYKGAPEVELTGPSQIKIIK